MPRARCPYPHRLQSTPRRRPRRTTSTRRSHRRFRVHSLRVPVRCHSIQRRWSPLTRRHPHHPHHHHPRVRVPLVASSQSSGRTGVEPPSCQISYRRRRSRRGTKSNRLIGSAHLLGASTFHRSVSAAVLACPWACLHAFVSHIYCLSSLPFLMSSHTYGRVCRIIFIGQPYCNSRWPTSPAHAL